MLHGSVRAVGPVAGGPDDHVTRFAAAGKHAEYLLCRQPWDYEGGVVGNARSYLIDAKDLSRYAAAVMRETALS